MTASIRFGGYLNNTLGEFQTRLNPYPRIHLLLSSYSPIIPSSEVNTEDISIGEITQILVSSRYLMVKCNPRHGKYMSMCIIYRGNIAPKDIGSGIYWVKTSRTVQFVDWCPTGFTCGINYRPMYVVNDSVIKKTSKSAYMLANSTAIGEDLERFRRKLM